ncbi:MarR family winged helix-turn-helix transcriptional regulator [Rubrivirga sp. SAORIC476]|uniref:MarR family winged helix-turn-helix transcriptional regulator n=1 Tax=Rubrivirga sp. SAORIC476 TaxID=1961794 RepID=UPI001304547A|nr:MarR family winged helix-turn-helix transcriptional regulator [Rubrivirga sp. SAORIC476]
MSSQPFSEADAPRALAQLFERWTGASSHADVEEGRGGLDAVVHVGPHVFLVEVKGDPSPTSIEAALAHLRRQSMDGAAPLVVVPHMSPSGAERCESEGVAWADLSGNAHVTSHTPGGDLYVHVSGRPNAFETRGRPRNAFAPKSARLARTLLASPGAAWTQKELAEATDLDAGHVSRLVRRLLNADLVYRDNDGLITAHDPARLLDAWADGNAFRHEVITGHLPGRSGEERARRLADVFDRDGISYALTGLAAAWAYTQAAGFRLVTCYVTRDEHPTPVAVASEAGFRTDTRAPNVRLLVPDDRGVFDGVRPVKGLRCVAPAQTYVDLEHDSERGPELQDALRPLALDPPPPAS